MKKQDSTNDLTPVERKTIAEHVEERLVSHLKPILEELGVSPDKLKNYKWTANELVGFAVGQIRYEKEKKKAVVMELKKAAYKAATGSQEHINFVTKILEEV